MDAMVAKMAPFGNRNILFVDSMYDGTGVVERIQELGLRPFVIHDPLEVADKATCPHIDTIVVDSLSVVCYYFLRLEVRGCNGVTDRDDPRI
jgi:osomolarity two-component system sensor histidine kinase NIK1